MNIRYSDIIEKLGKPKWWDICGYPRYCEFHPNEYSNIYCRYIAYMVIQCQCCEQKFKVAEGVTEFQIFKWAMSEGLKLKPTDTIKEIQKDYLPKIDGYSVILDSGLFNYGDPPWHDCPGAGESMSSEPLILLSFWLNDHEWKKINKKELKK